MFELLLFLQILMDPKCRSLFNRKPVTAEFICRIFDWSVIDEVQGADGRVKGAAVKRAEVNSKQWLEGLFFNSSEGNFTRLYRVIAVLIFVFK